MNLLFYESGKTLGGASESIYLHCKFLKEIKPDVNIYVIFSTEIKDVSKFRDLGANCYFINDDHVSVNKTFIGSLIYFLTYPFIYISFKTNLGNKEWVKYLYILQSYRFYRKVKHLIKKKKIDIVHSNTNPWKDRTFIIAGVRANKKVIIHHRNRLHKMPLGLAKYLIKNSYKNVFNSGFVLNHWVNYFPFYNRERNMVIYNPVNSDRKIDKKVLKGQHFVFVGRIIKNKGVLDLTKIFYQISKSLDNITLSIIGEGELFDELNGFLRRNNIQNIKLSGFIPQNKIDFNLFDGLIFYSVPNYEGLGRVLLEALAMGLPIIATESGGNIEIVEDNYNSILVEYNNELALKDAIIRLQENEFSQLLSKNGFKTIENKFSTQIYKLKTRELYEF